MEQDFARRLERLRELQRARHGLPPAAASIAGAAAAAEAVDARDASADTTAVDGRPGDYAPWEPVPALDLRLMATEAGTAYVRESVYPLTYCHGSCPLDLAATISEPAWRALGGHVPGGSDVSAGQWQVPLTECAFLDVETSGLAGGTGTVAFLIGLALVESDCVRVRQYFMPDFGDEPALLCAVNADLTGRRTLVTYNGKTFDWPLLETRFVMNRLRPAMRSPLHIDLLHAARRIWQEHLADRRLATVEAQILGHERTDDVPGALIPALYFAYQRGGDARPLRPVLEHNEQDLISLIALLGLIGEALADPVNSRLRHAAEYHGLGRWCVDLGFPETGLLCLELARRNPLSPGAEEHLLRDLAGLYKRLRQQDDANRIWESLVAAGVLSTQPYVELAKYHEHTERDYGAALELVERALSLASLPTGQAAGRERSELLHRRERLLRKLQRQA